MSDPNEIPIDDVSGVEERPQNRRQWSGAVQSLVLPALIVATIVGALLWYERGRDDGRTAASDGYGIVALPDAKNVTGRAPSTDEGRAAPDFLLRTLDGGDLRFSDLQGQPVLVNFWASWCTPCREEMPDIVRAYDEYRDDGLVVVAVNLQENEEQVRAFADDFGMEFRIAFDRTGQVADAWRIGGPVEGIPSSYFIDGRGIVQKRVFGPLTEKSLTEHIEALLQ